MKDYRPISLCNVTYKIIARVTNKLKNIMGNIIDPHQSAFIPGRSIIDNILLGYECMHWLRNSKNKQGYATLKLDMSKAYGRVEWTYLKVVLTRMGFTDKWVDLVMRCVTSVVYSFNINGKVIGRVTPSRGLRQGDPLSPYLFVLCSQGLSSILDHCRRANRLQGIRVASGSPMITLLFFADVSLIFFKPTEHNTIKIKNILNAYEKDSGQIINFEKSAITFSKNTPRSHISFLSKIPRISQFAKVMSSI